MKSCELLTTASATAFNRVSLTLNEARACHTRHHFFVFCLRSSSSARRSATQASASPPTPPRRCAMVAAAPHEARAAHARTDRRASTRRGASAAMGAGRPAERAQRPSRARRRVERRAGLVASGGCSAESACGSIVGACLQAPTTANSPLGRNHPFIDELCSENASVQKTMPTLHRSASQKLKIHRNKHENLQGRLVEYARRSKTQKRLQRFFQPQVAITAPSQPTGAEDA